MVPYDMATFSHSDLHPLSLAHLGHHDLPIASAAALHQSPQIVAESSINAVTDTRSNLVNLSSANTSQAPNNKEIKRTDVYYTGK